MLKRGADAKIITPKLTSVVDAAVKSGTNTVIVGKLLAAGATLVPKGLGVPVIHRAAAAGKVEMLEYLVSKGANVNTVSSFGETALHQAVYNQKSAAVTWLLEHGANVNATGHSGETALAVAQKNSYTAIVELLKKHGAQ